MNEQYTDSYEKKITSILLNYKQHNTDIRTTTDELINITMELIENINATLAPSKSQLLLDLLKKQKTFIIQAAQYNTQTIHIEGDLLYNALEKCTKEITKNSKNKDNKNICSTVFQMNKYFLKLANNHYKNISSQKQENILSVILFTCFSTGIIAINLDNNYMSYQLAHSAAATAEIAIKTSKPLSEHIPEIKKTYKKLLKYLKKMHKPEDPAVLNKMLFSSSPPASQPRRSAIEENSAPLQKNPYPKNIN